MGTAIRAAFAAAVCLAIVPASVDAQTKVVFGQAAPPGLFAAPIEVAKQLGYFKDEGIEIDERAFPGGSNSVTQTVNGTAMVSWSGNEPVIIGKQQGRAPLPVRFYYNAIPTLIWEMVTLESSPIRTLSDLRGKAIGIFSPAASNVPQVKALLRREGINSDKDVTFRNVGLGAGALNALTSGAVDVVALYDIEHAAFEAMGAKIRHLPQSPVLAPLFSNGLLTRDDELADPAKRSILVGLARAMARGTIFCEANPRACVEQTYKQLPDIKPTGMDDAKALDQGVFVLQSRLQKMAPRDYQNGQYGRYDAGAWKAYVEFLHQEGVLETAVDPESLYTNDLIADINRFDREAVVRQAKAM
jgi:NitT/TauT family transport system substrate-binding protein